jgi:Crp-like helix-turn-helix domain
MHRPLAVGWVESRWRSPPRSAGRCFPACGSAWRVIFLDLASDRAGAVLVARITQQELADAVGTVREVVVRTLRDMRRDGLVETGRTGIALSAPEGLLAEAYPVPGQPTGRG